MAEESDPGLFGAAGSSHVKFVDHTSQQLLWGVSRVVHRNWCIKDAQTVVKADGDRLLRGVSWRNIMA